MKLILVGFMGTFKTSAGSIAAKKLGAEFFDTDRLYEKNYGISIADTFKEYGETVFRDRESDVLSGILNKCENFVLSTGGGIVLKELNREMIKSSGAAVVELYANKDELYKRIANDKSRPIAAELKSADELWRRYAEREPYYKEIAKIRVDTSGKTPEAAADEIIRLI